MKKKNALRLFLLLLAYVAGMTLGAVKYRLSAVAPAMRETQTRNMDTEACKKAALTFDDGPNPIYTKILLDGLKKRGVKATFFLLGSQVKEYPEVVERMQREGHLIGVHSYDHVNFGQIGNEKTLEQVSKTQEMIYEVTGQYPDYIRPPYGCWKKELNDEIPLIEVLWDVDPCDWATTDADTVVQRVMKQVKDGSIILLHDASNSSVQAAFRIIDQLEEQNYELVTVEDLLLGY